MIDRRDDPGQRRLDGGAIDLRQTRVEDRALPVAGDEDRRESARCSGFEVGRRCRNLVQFTPWSRIISIRSGILSPGRFTSRDARLHWRSGAHLPRRRRLRADVSSSASVNPVTLTVPRQWVIRVDDLVEPRLEEIVLSAVPPLPGPHQITLRQADGEQNHDQTPRSICKKSGRQPLPSCKCNNSDPRKHFKNEASPYSSRTTNPSLGQHIVGAGSDAKGRLFTILHSFYDY